MSDALEFTKALAAVLQAVAWPLVVAFIFLRLQQPLRALLIELLGLVPKIQEAKLGALEFKLRMEAVQAVVETSPEGAAPAVTPGVAPSSFRHNRDYGTDLPPSFLVSHAWDELQMALVEWSVKHGGADADPRSVGRRLLEAEVFADVDYIVLTKLLPLTEIARHTKNIDAEDAIAFATQASQLQRKIYASMRD